MADKILQFIDGAADLLKMAKRASDEGDHYTAVTCLNRILTTKPDNFDALITLAKEYNSVEEYRMGKQVLFKLLPKYADDAEVNYCLSMSLAAEGDVYGAENYLRRIGDVEQLPGEMRTYISDTFESVFTFFEDKEDEIRLVKPRTEKYYQDRIDAAEDMAHEGDFRSAIRILKTFTEDTPLYDKAATLLVTCYGTLGDYDAAIATSEEVLCRYPDNISVLCTYYTLLKMHDRELEADKVMARLETVSFPNDFSLIAKGIQAFVAGGMHHKVLELVNMRLKDRPFEVYAWTLKAIALYNVGLQEECRRQFVRMAAFYPEMTSAESYLSYLEQKPKEIAYSLGEPFTEYILKSAMVDRLIALTKKEFDSVKKDNIPLMKWGVKKLTDPVVFKLLGRLTKSYDDDVRKLYEELLTDSDVDIAYKHEILYGMAKAEEKKTLNVVAENVFRTVKFKHADFKDFPKVLKESYCISAAELAILYPENDCYQEELNRLTHLIKQDDIPCGNKQLFSTEKSVKTLSAVFNYIAEERNDMDFNKQRFFKEYKVDKSLFEQYLSMIYDKRR